MTQKFKVGDLVYCAKRKMFGYVYEVSELNCSVSFYFNFDECQNLSSHYLTGKRSSIFRVTKLNVELVLAFTNYCISEGFASRAIKRDLVTFLNSMK